jgi:hypothetical protein
VLSCAQILGAPFSGEADATSIRNSVNTRFSICAHASYKIRYFSFRRFLIAIALARLQLSSPEAFFRGL